MFARFRHDKAAAPQGPPHNGHHGAGAKAGLNAPSDSLTQPPLRFAGRRDYDIEPGADEWGLTPNQQVRAKGVTGTIPDFSSEAGTRS